jgi:hypothetical protein
MVGSGYRLSVRLSATGPRRNLVWVDSAAAIQVRALGSSLWTCMYLSFAVVRSGTQGKAPCPMALWVSSSNRGSTRFNQDEDLGVRCRWNRGDA